MCNIPPDGRSGRSGVGESQLFRWDILLELELRPKTDHENQWAWCGLSRLRPKPSTSCWLRLLLKPWVCSCSTFGRSCLGRFGNKQIRNLRRIHCSRGGSYRSVIATFADGKFMVLKSLPSVGFRVSPKHPECFANNSVVTFFVNVSRLLS